MTTNDPTPHPTPHPEHTRAEPLLPLSFVIAALVLGQISFYFWKKRNPKSYHRITLLLLWLFPLIIAISSFYWRFLIVWLLFSIITCTHLYVALRGNIINDHTLPRRVYFWFSAVYRVSYGMALLGYLLIILEIFSISPLEVGVASYWGVMLLFYGLYFGVLGRDSAELSAHRMAIRMGLLVQDGMPLRVLPSSQCGICGKSLSDTEEDMMTLDCDHRFHSFCIRGWALLGKKDTCPFCREKVDLKRLIPSHPWQAENTVWALLLDAVRFSVAWTPILTFVGVTVSRMLA